MTGSTTPDFDSLTVDGAAQAGSVQSVGTGTVTAGSVVSSNAVRINPIAAGTSPSVQALGIDANVGIRFIAKGTGTFNFNQALNVTGRIQTQPTVAWSGSAPVNIPLMPLSVTATVNGTITNTQTVPLNRIDTTDNIVGNPLFGHTGLLVNHALGASSVGFGQAFQVVASDLATTGQFAAGGEFSLVGGNIGATASFNQGGTALAKSGFLFGFNTVAILNPGATHFGNLIGYELDIGALAGSAPARKIGLAITKFAADADAGTLGYDSAIAIADAPGGTSSAWVYGVAIGNNTANPNTIAGGAALATLFCGAPTGGGAGLSMQSLAWLVDGSQSTQTGGALRAKGVVINGNGDVRSGKAYLRSTAAGAALGADGFMAATATIASGGTGWLTGNHAQDSGGNVWTVTAAAGVITAVALVNAEPSATAATPLTILATATGATAGSINVAYDTGTTLEINPGGGPIKTALLGNFANDAAAATGGVVVGQFYRNGSIVMQRVA